MPNMVFYGSMVRHNTYLIMVSMRISLDHLMLLKYHSTKRTCRNGYAVLPAQEKTNLNH